MPRAGISLEQARRIALALPEAFIEKLPWGAKIVGLRLRLRLQLPRAPMGLVAELIRQAWRAKAPKALQ